MTYGTKQNAGRSALRKASKLAAVSLLALAGLAQTASAYDTTITFTGTITDTCVVAVTNSGILGVNTEQTRLASDEGLGLAATAGVVTNSPRSQIQVLAPIAFETAPVGSELNTSFDTAYSLTGTTNADVSDGQTLTPLEVGASVLSVDAGATKSEGTFEGGAYSFVTTVRCITQ